jgi:hypothetical protein
VGQVPKDLEPLRDDLVAGLTIQGGYETEPAGVVFERRIVQALASR